VSRFVEYPGDSVPLGTYIPPLTVPELLKRMELTEAAREHQQAAIDAWLSCHEPPPLLRYGLTRDGFLPSGEEAPV
jgi:hypothetical protein